MPKKRIPLMIGYVVFAIVCLMLNLYWTFPASALAQRVVHEVEKQTDGVWKIAFKDASPYRFTGLQLDGVTVTKRANPGGDPTVLQFDSLRARLRLFPLLLLRASVSVQAILGDGSLAAKITPRRDAVDVTLAADSLNLGSTAMFAKLTGLPLAGVVNGSIDTHWTYNPHKVEADGDLEIEAAGLGPGKVANLVTIPQTGLGDLALKAEIREGKLKVTSFKQSGKPVNIRLQAGGGVQLSDPVPTSTFDLCMQFKPEEAFLNSNPTMRSAVQLAEVQLKRDGDGFINLPLGGTVMQPQVRTGTLCKR